MEQILSNTALLKLKVQKAIFTLNTCLDVNSREKLETQINKIEQKNKPDLYKELAKLVLIKI